MIPIFIICCNIVTKLDSITIKLRVVFNGFSRTPNQSSLNDHLLPGPKLEEDIPTILLNVLFHKVVITADTKMMYREIVVEPSHRNYQRILWRFSPDDTIQDYRLSTLTYGLNCFPYIAIRTLLQLVKEDGCNYPLASKAITDDTCMDYRVTGVSSVLEANNLEMELVSLLAKGRL